MLDTCVMLKKNRLNFKTGGSKNQIDENFMTTLQK
jgi:hypothetical protein